MGPLQRFAADLLEREGALVEAVEADGLEVVSPPALQERLGIPEFSRLGFGATPPPGGQRVGIEGDWLDRFAAVIGERGRWTRRVLQADNPPLSGVDRILEHEIQLGNATFRLLGAGPAWTRCLVLDFRFTAFSDEKRDGMLRFGLNLATGAALDGVLERLVPHLAEGAADAMPSEEAGLPPPWPRERVLDVLDRALPPRLARQIDPFVKGLRRRMARDQERLHTYHNDLHREAMRRLAALPEGHEGRRREELRAAAAAREYRAKLDDLAHKYAMRIAVEWVQTLELVMPVQRLRLLVRRRKGERVIEVDWNPLARRLEWPACEFEHAAERARLVCDDALHLVSPPGLAPCAGCGKPYCRACHGERCPKCGRPARAARWVR